MCTPTRRLTQTQLEPSSPQAQPPRTACTGSARLRSGAGPSPIEPPPAAYGTPDNTRVPTADRTPDGTDYPRGVRAGSRRERQMQMDSDFQSSYAKTHHVAGTEAQARRGSQPQVLSTLFSETRCLIWLDQLDSEPQGPTCPCLPSAGVTSMHHHNWLFSWIQGNRIQDSCLQGKHC